MWGTGNGAVHRQPLPAFHNIATYVAAARARPPEETLMLTRYMQNDPFTDLFRLQDQLLRPRKAREGRADLTPEGFVPAVDVYEADDQLVFEAELPGIAPEDVEIEVEKGVLTLRGARETTRKTDDEGTLRLERSWGRFERAFRLSETIDPDSADAAMDNGVLTVRFAKQEAARPRRIQVNGSKRLSDADKDADLAA